MTVDPITYEIGHMLVLSGLTSAQFAEMIRKSTPGSLFNSMTMWRYLNGQSVPDALKMRGIRDAFNQFMKGKDNEC